jgi:hypothetical protein
MRSRGARTHTHACRVDNRVDAWRCINFLEGVFVRVVAADHPAETLDWL